MRCNWEMIQRSTEDSSTGSPLTPVSWPSVFSMTKLAAFQILLQKLRKPSTRPMSNLMSRPVEASEQKVKRRASVP